MSVREFMTGHYRHFNAATVVEAAQGYEDVLAKDGKMMVTLAGAMSTAELGRSLAEMIRQDKVHAITCTGANLEEDVFFLMAASHYIRIADWRNLTLQQEQDLCDAGMNRVTDTCIPEEEAFRKLEGVLVELWKKAEREGVRKFPHEFLYELLLSGTLKDGYEGDPKHSWLLAAAEKNLPIFVPGWEDSTSANIFAAHCIQGDIKSPTLVKGGIEYMIELVGWYREASVHGPGIGFFQIGGGIAGDFPICVVPMIHQDLGKAAPLWAYFCQISDSTTSYGSYSGAIPSEKITWGKLGVDTPMFVIESDATIVAPLVFAYILNW